MSETNYIISRSEFIQRLMAAGCHTEDYADSLYLAYTDINGCSQLTPEEVMEEDKQFKPFLY